MSHACEIEIMPAIGHLIQFDDPDLQVDWFGAMSRPPQQQLGFLYLLACRDRFYQPISTCISSTAKEYYKCSSRKVHLHTEKVQAACTFSASPICPPFYVYTDGTRHEACATWASEVTSCSVDRGAWGFFSTGAPVVALGRCTFRLEPNLYGFNTRAAEA